MKLKGADPVQKAIVENIRRAVRVSMSRDREGELEMDADSIPFVTDKNVSTHLGGEKSLEEVLVLMIDSLRNNMKTVDTQSKP